jgi:hypothetical protein
MLAGWRQANRSIRLRCPLGKNRRTTGTSRIIQGRLYTTLNIALANPPDRRGIPLDVLAQGADLLVLIRTPQKNLGAPSYSQ